MIRSALLALLLGLVGAAPGQDVAAPAAGPAATRAAEQHYRAGQTQHAQAEMATSPEEARRFSQAAIAEYEAAIAAQPTHCPARFYLAVCLSQLGSLTAAGPERTRHLQEADQRYAAAADCPGVDPAVFEQWAILLRTDLYNALADPAEKRAVLERTVQACERGLPLATAPTPRAQLQRHLGSALVWSAALVEDPAERRGLLGRAVANLRAAHQVVAARQSLYQDNDLGTALMSLGHLTGDRALLREAAAELEAALKFYPEQYDTSYNLATAYCLLGEVERAGQSLAVAIDHDVNGEFARHAAADPLLAPMRGSAAYTAALDRRRRELAEVKARDCFQQGLAAQQTAEQTNDLVVAAALLERAVGFYEQAVELTPDHYQAQSCGAIALAQLGQLGGREPDRQRRQFEAARQRFATAARCPGVDALLYDQWSIFLLSNYYPLMQTAADQQRVLAETRQVLEDGLRVARFSGLRGHLESQLGICLVLLAQSSGSDPPPRRTLPERSHGSTTLPPDPGATQSPASLYVEAVKHFQAAAAAQSVNRSARFYHLWGSALLGAAQSGRDPALIRQATERLLKSLELDPANPSAEYDLACAYTLLRQPEPAARHLERCLALDAQGTFAATAQTDPDLEPLRRTERYRRLIQARRPIPPSDRPTVSEK